MQQDSEEQPGTVLPGLIELQALLGEQVQGVGTLHLAKERSQARLTQACWVWVFCDLCRLCTSSRVGPWSTLFEQSPNDLATQT